MGMIVQSQNSDIQQMKVFLQQVENALNNHASNINQMQQMLHRHDATIVEVLDMPWWKRIFLTLAKMNAIIQRKQAEAATMLAEQQRQQADQKLEAEAKLEEP